MLGNDIRFALRQIARAPVFSGVVITVIALGIGINAGLLTTLNTHAWRPAPGIEPDAQLARLTPIAARGENRGRVDVSLSYPDILDLRERRDVVSDVAAWASAWLAADFGSGAEVVSSSYATVNFFRLLRVPMAAGVGFPDGVDLSSERMVVIGHSLWMTNFDGSPDAIGKTIRVMNQPFTIVGVAPPRFTGIDIAAMGRPSIWIPLGARTALQPAARDELTRRDAVFLKGVARLAPGVNAGDVASLTAPLAARIAQEEPKSHRDLVIRAERLTGMRQGASDTKETLAAFFIVAFLIVVITCTNVSALLLGRAVARRREIAVRLSLGATRLRVLRQMLTESLVLALFGALFGSMLYIASVKVAYAAIPEVVYGLEPQPVTFLFAAMFALATTIAFGLAPALHAIRTDIGEALKNSGTLAIRRSRLQAAFVVVQLAASQPVLVVTSLVLVGMGSGTNDAAETALASVVTMDSELFGAGNAGGGSRSLDSVSAAVQATYDLTRRRISEISGVQSAALSARDRSGESFQPTDSAGLATAIEQTRVSADFFSTLGLPIVRGRAIGAEEDRPGSVAVVINAKAATILWPGENPIGKRLIRHRRADGESQPVEAQTLEVIGVAANAPHNEGPRSEVYTPLSGAASVSEVRIAVRTSGDARAFVPQVRAAIREVEPLATASNVATLAEQEAFRQREAFLSNLAGFAVGASALALAAIGLYAIIAFAVAQRTREIGVRLAIGATSGDVVRQFLREGLNVTAIGLGVGLPVTIAGIRVVQANLSGFTLQDIGAILLVLPVLMLVATLASFLPARRAGRVDPLVALRSE